MPSYVITGVSRGLGYEFLRQYSSEPESLVIGLVRNKAETDKKVSEDPDLKTRSNIHILQADITDYNALKQAAADTAKFTGGSVDCLIANAGYVPKFDAVDGIGDLGDSPEELTKTMRDLFEINVLGNIHFFNLFMPLILKGEVKKVITITSGYGDIEITKNFDLEASPLYSVSKAAANMVIAKFSAQYKKDGILFLSVCPGVAEVGHFSGLTERQQQRVGAVAAKFMEYAPHWKGPQTPEQSVAAVRSVIANASIEKGNGGDYVSHFGNKQWL
ncbi:NAD(P)-binding protein [Canariomyces notabilis]|uniref:NAD(P)-binding protein n=1 Tax=Canariomyces notabilis TaxID=2074819 RepID=A0AAN6QPT1_9PEZI|nr:NAD(P)-binding protein [Canariomyces arenarius]